MPNSAAAEELQTITLSDFSAGIWSDQQAQGSVMPAPDGAATLNGTFGCVAAPSGGLMGGPRKVDTLYNEGLTGTFGPQTVTPSFGKPELIVTSFLVLPGIQPTDDDAPLSRQVLIAQAAGLFIGATTSQYKTRMNLYKPAGTSPGEEVGQTATPLYQMSLNIAGAAATWNGLDPLAMPSAAVVQRSNHTNPDRPGTPFIVASHMAADVNGGNISNSIFSYPDSATPTADSIAAIANFVVTPGQLYSHQGRVIATSLGLAGQSIGTANLASTSDILDYTAANDLVTASGLNAGAIFASESPAGIGSATTMNASEFVVVRRFGGAYVIRGDIAAPQIVSLPGVEPTGHDPNLGVLVPGMGYVYGAASGVWVWNGGDISINMSQQLWGLSNPVYGTRTGRLKYNRPFWLPATPRINPAGVGASFAYCYPYIYTPNNFIYDIRLNSWFRVGDGSTTYTWWGKATDSTVAGSPSVVSESQRILADFYDSQQAASSYQWTSHPLQKSMGRYIQARGLNLVAIGSGTITVTLKSTLETSQPVKFTIRNNTGSTGIYLPTACTGTDFQCIIQSKSFDGVSPAPRVNRLNIMWSEMETARG